MEKFSEDHMRKIKETHKHNTKLLLKRFGQAQCIISPRTESSLRRVSTSFHSELMCVILYMKIYPRRR